MQIYLFINLIIALVATASPLAFQRRAQETVKDLEKASARLAIAATLVAFYISCYSNS